MIKFFVTGTDTGVGKTLTCAVLALALEAWYWKPIQSGVANDTADSDTVKALSGLPDCYFCPSQYVFPASLSPHQAAELAGVTIEIQNCKTPPVKGPLIVEGAGGLFVPLNQDTSIMHLIKFLHLPVIIVSRGTLGTINHTLLSIEALRNRNIPILGVVFSGELNLENQVSIEKWGEVKTLFHIPHFETVTPAIVQQWTNENIKQITESIL
jgi:dethiobiotin synthase